MPDDDRTQWYNANLTHLINLLARRDAAPDIGYRFDPFPSYAIDVDGDTGTSTVTLRVIPNPSVRNAIALGLDVVGHILLMLEEDYSDWPKHTRRSVDTYGVHVNPDDLETLPNHVYRRLYPLAGIAGLPVRILRQVVRSHDSDAVAIVDWKDGKELITYSGLPRAGARFEDLRPAWDAVAEIGGIKPNPGGSPPGPRKGQVWSRRECLEWWDGWKLDREPTQRDLADAIGVTDTETAVGRWRSTGLHWPPTEDELNEPGAE